MNFTETLEAVVERVDGAASAMIIGADGIPVEQYVKEQLLDLTELGAETSQMIKDIGVAAENLRMGSAQEFSIISDLCGVIMRKITEDYFLALVLREDGNYGKGRYVLKNAASRIVSDF